MTPQNTSDTGERVSTFVSTLAYFEGLKFRITLYYRVETKWNVFWESNPTNIKSPVFRGNTAITLICQKTLRDPILPMFSLCLSDGGVWDSSFE